MFKKLKDKKKEKKEEKGSKSKKVKDDKIASEESGEEVAETKGKKKDDAKEDIPSATPEKKHSSKKDKEKEKDKTKEKKKEKKEKKKKSGKEEENDDDDDDDTGVPKELPPKSTNDDEGDEKKEKKKKKKKKEEDAEEANEDDNEDTHHHKKTTEKKKKKKKKSKKDDEDDHTLKLDFEDDDDDDDVDEPQEVDPFNEKIDIKSVHTQPPDTYSFTSECPPIFETILNGGIEEAKTAIRNLPNKDIQCPELLITPLHLACVTGKVPLVELLLDLGAKPMIRDSLDNTPLHLCAYFRRYHTARKFLLKIKDKEIAQKLVNLINHAGMSPLYVASATGDVRLMELFSKYGADINSCALENRTPLHEAALSGNSKAVDFLLKNGADMTVLDITQRTPLHYSVLTEVESRDVVTSLTQANTCFFMTDRWGFTPLQYAILQSFDSVISLFTMNKNGCNVCTVYDLRKQMIMETAPKIPELPKPLGLPIVEPDRPRSVTYLIKPGRPLPEGVSPDEVNPVDSCLQSPKLSASGGPTTTEKVKANRYGFITLNPLTETKEMTDRDRAEEAEKTELWTRILKDWDRMASDSDKIREYCKRGVPETVRGEVWKRLGGVVALIKKQPKTYSILIKTTTSPDVSQQIDLDVKRSHIEHEYFAKPYSAGQIAMFNMMRAYSLYDPVIGYTQSMSDIAGFLLMYLQEEDAFWVFVQLMFDPRWAMQQYFTDGFPKLSEACFIQARLLKKHLPDVYDHMLQVDFIPETIQPHAMEWFMAMFIRILPYEITFRIFDVIMSQGYDVVYNFSMGMYKILKPELLKVSSYPYMMQTLKSPVQYIGKVSPDDFIKTSMKFDIENDVKAFRNEYNEMMKK